MDLLFFFFSVLARKVSGWVVNASLVTYIVIWVIHASLQPL